MRKSGRRTPKSRVHIAKKGVRAPKNSARAVRSRDTDADEKVTHKAKKSARVKTYTPKPTRPWKASPVSDAAMKQFEAAVTAPTYVTGTDKGLWKKELTLQATKAVTKANIDGITAAYVGNSEPVGDTWQSRPDRRFIHPVASIAAGTIAMVFETGRPPSWYQAHVEVVPESVPKASVKKARAGKR